MLLRFKDELTVKAKVIPAETLNLAGIIGAAIYGELRLKDKKKKKDKEKKSHKED